LWFDTDTIAGVKRRHRTTRTAAAVRNMTEHSVRTTRREFSIQTGALALIGAGVLVGFSVADLQRPALAQNPSLTELMQPGPLGEMSLGSDTAPVTIIEYASMTCPHCADFHEKTYPELKKKYIDTGKIRFIFREFPLDQLAAAAFMLARCGGKERFFPMIETLFQQQRDWVVQRPLAPLMAISKQAGISEQAFNECLKNQQVLDGIEDVRQRASQKLNVQSTPTFFINGKVFRGAATLAELEKEITPYLKD
jgi:protein-disulfide isomerase